MAVKSVNNNNNSKLDTLHDFSLDVAVIGSGPAALTAALYLARAGLRVKVFERGSIGGELALIGHISNYPGYEGGGKELAEGMRAQAEQAGAEFDYGECTDIRPEASGFTLEIDHESVRAAVVLVATGSEPIPLDFGITPPVSYCALCDIDLAHDQNIAVVGGGNSAVQESLLLAPVATTLTLISHSPLKADQCLRDRLSSESNVTIRENLEPTPELLADFDRVFVFTGKKPALGCLGNLLEQPGLIDERGYLLTNEASHQSVIPGLFAAGDVRAGSIHQVITAAGDGAAAAVEIRQLLANPRK